jgi:hypothetical protein
MVCVDSFSTLFCFLCCSLSGVVSRNKGSGLLSIVLVFFPQGRNLIAFILYIHGSWMALLHGLLYMLAWTFWLRTSFFNVNIISVIF